MFKVCVIKIKFIFYYVKTDAKYISFFRHAFFDFEYEEDAERMVAELHKSLYFGSFISARIEQQKQGKISGPDKKG